MYATRCDAWLTRRSSWLAEAQRKDGGVSARSSTPDRLPEQVGRSRLSTEPGHIAAATQPPADGALLIPAALRVRRWNWGAFAFTWLWGLFNGAYLPLLGLLLGLVPSVELWRHALPGGGSVWISTGTLLYTAWSVYCGVMGDRWAARGHRWRDAAHFRSAQHQWAVAALVAAIVLAVVVAAVLAAASAGLIY